MPAETVHIPAREGRAIRLHAGDRVRVIDPQGGQVADLFAFTIEDPSEYHSAEHTRVHVSRLFPPVGQQFVTNRRATGTRRRTHRAHGRLETGARRS